VARIRSKRRIPCLFLSVTPQRVARDTFRWGGGSVHPIPNCRPHKAENKEAEHFRVVSLAPTLSQDESPAGVAPERRPPELECVNSCQARKKRERSLRCPIRFSMQKKPNLRPRLLRSSRAGATTNCSPPHHHAGQHIGWISKSSARLERIANPRNPCPSILQSRQILFDPNLPVSTVFFPRIVSSPSRNNHRRWCDCRMTDREPPGSSNFR